MKKFIYVLIALTFVLGFSLAWVHANASAAKGAAPDNMGVLGKAIFFDPSLSANGTQSCATCHAKINRLLLGCLGHTGRSSPRCSRSAQ